LHRVPPHGCSARMTAKSWHALIPSVAQRVHCCLHRQGMEPLPLVAWKEKKSRHLAIRIASQARGRMSWAKDLFGISSDDEQGGYIA
jgi:hypothetical protein